MSGTGPSGGAVETRTVVVEPLSSRREAVLVARAVFHIIFWSAFLIGLERGKDSSAERSGARIATPSLDVGEVALTDLDAQDQKMFREVGAAVAELESVRSATGAWPSVAELAGRGVPPFAADTAGYRWRALRDNAVTNYLGLPDASTGRATFAIVLVEPEPGIPADPRAIQDEIHHRLADGSMLHVSIWRAPGVRDGERPLAAPAPEDGWRRITMKSR